MVVDSVRVSAQVVLRALEAGTAPVRGLARWGSDSLLAALLAVLGDSDRDEDQPQSPEAVGEATGAPSPAEVINRGLLTGTGPLHAWKSPNSPEFPWTIPGGCGVRWGSRKPTTTNG